MFDLLVKKHKMTNIYEIKEAVEHLSREDFSLFREWFLEFEAHQWDQQIEADIKAGKLDELAQQALKDFESNQCTEL